MKQRLVKTLLASAAFILILNSCKKDEDYHKISIIETSVFNKLNDYRTDNGLDKLVMNMVMFEEANALSNQLAKETITAESPSISEKLQELTSNFGGTTNSWLVLTCNYENADSIVKIITSDEDAANLVKQDYTQEGVGITTAENSIVHICLLFMMIPD